MTDVGLTGADPLDITQSGHEPTFLWIGWQESVEYANKGDTPKRTPGIAVARDVIAEHPTMTNDDVITECRRRGVAVSSSTVSQARKPR